MVLHCDVICICKVAEECVVDNRQIVDLHTQHSPSHCCGIQHHSLPFSSGNTWAWPDSPTQRVCTVTEKWNTDCIVHPDPVILPGRCITVQVWAAELLKPTVFLGSQCSSFYFKKTLKLHEMFNQTTSWIVSQKMKNRSSGELEPDVMV